MMTDRNLENYGQVVESRELKYLWNKISAAGEMKSAIKRFLDTYDRDIDLDDYETVVKHRKELKGRVKNLRKAMENYLNCIPRPPKDE